MRAYVINHNGSSDNLPCFPPDSH